MRLRSANPQRRSPPARALRRLGHKVVPSKKLYSRKGRGVVAERSKASVC